MCTPARAHLVKSAERADRGNSEDSEEGKRMSATTRSWPGSALWLSRSESCLEREKPFVSENTVCGKTARWAPTERFSFGTQQGLNNSRIWCCRGPSVLVVIVPKATAVLPRQLHQLLLPQKIEQNDLKNQLIAPSDMFSFAV